MRAALAAVLALSLYPALSACASFAYAGVTPGSRSHNPEIRQLARRAGQGDKLSQLELGIRYEEGRGVPVDLEAAMKLYSLAAADGRGILWLYSPPVGAQNRGQVVPVTAGPATAGLSSAKQRLRKLRERIGP